MQVNQSRNHRTGICPKEPQRAQCVDVLRGKQAEGVVGGDQRNAEQTTPVTPQHGPSHGTRGGRQRAECYSDDEMVPAGATVKEDNNEGMAQKQQMQFHSSSNLGNHSW